MPKKSFDKTKEKRDSGKEIQATSGKPVASDWIKEASREHEVKPFRDKAQQSEVGSSSDLSEKIAIPVNFKQIEGNTELAKAQVIFLEEAYVSHYKDIVGFINAHAKRGDIVLVEGTQAGQKQDKLSEVLGKAVDLGYLPTDRDKLGLISRYKSYGKREYLRLIEQDKMPPLFRKDIALYGWDDMNAWHGQQKIDFNLEKETFFDPNDNRIPELYEKMRDRDADLNAKRVQKMLETIENMRTKFSDKKLFVVATEFIFMNTMKQENLKRQKYVALMIKDEPMEEDKQKYDVINYNLMKKMIDLKIKSNT
jgi:hypothetical protein